MVESLWRGGGKGSFRDIELTVHEVAQLNFEIGRRRNLGLRSTHGGGEGGGRKRLRFDRNN